MRMSRRDVVTSAAALAAVAALPRRAQSAPVFAPQPGAWRTFETVTHIEIAKPEGKLQAWIPLPSVNEAEWFKSGDTTWIATGATAVIETEVTHGAKMLHVVWPDGTAPAVADVTCRFSTRDRRIVLASPTNSAQLPDSQRKLYTAPTDLIPIDGIVKEAAGKITQGASSDLDKARKIYDWVADNTFRNPKTRGCGLGDIRFLLNTGDLSGKCADLNALYVGLARASGLPARDVYGLRVGPSRFGYKSLGPSTEIVTKSQHCRAEVFIEGYGWIPVDPADVRKVVLEEPPGNLALTDIKVIEARSTLFGSWEMNWLAYNFAQDVVLPGSSGPKLGFLMYPQFETAAGRLDCLDPDNVKYTITAREIAV